jgi:putative ABC transport system ATP-binding protein
MTLTDNVALPLVYAGVERDAAAPASARRNSTASASAITSLAAQPHLRRPAATRGDRPRAGQFAALILADEPTGNLDSHTSEEIMDLFSELNRAGITIVLVTHEADIAAYARRQVRFLDGLIVSDVADAGKSARRMLKAMLGEAWQAMGANRMRTA